MLLLVCVAQLHYLVSDQVVDVATVVCEHKAVRRNPLPRVDSLCELFDERECLFEAILCIVSCKCTTCNQLAQKVSVKLKQIKVLFQAQYDLRSILGPENVL